MPIQEINIGSEENDGTGDTVRSSFQKVNSNFSELSVAVLSTYLPDTKPPAGMVLLKFRVPIGLSLTIEEDLPNSVGGSDTPPTDMSWVAEIYKNETQIGTITIEEDTTSAIFVCEDTQLEGADVLSIVSPDPASTTLYGPDLALVLRRN